MKGQIDLFDEIFVDNFAGGGGASTGIEIATALVRANLPEYCGKSNINTMADLVERMAI